jgi:hypothetical protein
LRALQRKALHPSGFDLDQPRTPAGNSDGGQWTRVAGPGARGGAPRGQFPGAMPGQQARLAAAESRAKDAIHRVRQVDPKWRPRPSVSSTNIEGASPGPMASRQKQRRALRNLHGLVSVPAHLPPNQFRHAGRVTVCEPGSVMKLIGLAEIRDVTPAAHEILEPSPATSFVTINCRMHGGRLLDFSRIASDVVLPKAGICVTMVGAARMAQSIRIAPTNSLLFISDPNGGEAPAPSRDVRIRSTTSCISVPCLMWQDGETDVTLGTAHEVELSESPVFDAMLDTPNRAVVVSTIEGRTALKVPVSAPRTRVRIWVNRPQEPDRVIVGVE